MRAGLSAAHVVQPLAAGGLGKATSGELWLDVKQYDPEQHYFPNLFVSTVMGGLPGSSHPAVFGRDVNARFFYANQTALAHYVSTSIPAALQSLTTYEIEAHVTAADYTPAADSVLAKVGSHEFRIDSLTGGLEITDGVTTAVSTAATGVTDATDVAFAVRVAGTAVDFETSTDGGVTWSALGMQVMAALTLPLPASGTMSVGSQSTTRGFNGRFYFVKWYDDTSTKRAEFLPQMFAPGNLGHGATGTDAQSNTWTVSRAGSPLSVIDTGDGNGKRVRGRATAANGLASNQTPSLSATDVFLWAWLAVPSASSADGHIIGQWDSGTDRSLRLNVNASDVPEVMWSTDGIAETGSVTLTAVPSWYTAGSYGWIGALYDHSAGDIIWYDGGSSTSPTWTAVETDSPGAFTANVSSLAVGVMAGASNLNPLYGDVLQAGIGASTSSLYDYSHFDAAEINRYQWRIENTVDTGSGPTGETWRATFTDSAEDANDPPQFWHHGTDYAYVTGSTSNYMIQTMDAGIANGSVVSVRADIAALDYTPAAASRVVDNGIYLMVNTDGKLLYSFFNALASFPTVSSSVVLPVVDGQQVQIRADHDNTNATVDFYYRFGHTALTGDTGWTALGAQQAITDDDFTATTVAGTGQFILGGQNVAGQHFDGRLYAGVILDDGTPVWSVDVSDASADGTSFTDSVTSNTVTISRATSGFATEIVKAPVWLHGGSHYIDVPHDTTFTGDISAGFALSAAVSARIHAQASTGLVLIDKKGAGTGWGFAATTTGPATVLTVDDGVDTATATSPSITASTRATVLAAITDGDHQTYTDGTGGTASTSVLVDDITDTGTLRIGSQNNAATNVLTVSAVHALAVLSKRVSDAEALAISNELAAA